MAGPQKYVMPPPAGSEQPRGAFQNMDPPQLPPPAGFTGQIPLPSARFVGTPIKNRSLTPAERAGLQAVGVLGDEEIPHDMAAIMQQVRAEYAIEINRPQLPEGISPNRPPLAHTIQDISTLPPEAQARVRQLMEESLQRQAQANQPPSNLAADAQRAVGELQSMGRSSIVVDDTPPAPPPRPAPQFVRRGQSAPVQQAPMQQTPAAPPPPPPPVATQPAPEPPPPPPPQSTLPPLFQPPPEPEAVSETGLDAPRPFCPHCGHDQSIPDDVEIKPNDREAYLVTLIGGLCFKKTVTLAEGKMSLTIRSLTVKELDAIYNQVRLDMKAGLVSTGLEYQELIDRYRLALQLNSIQSDGLNVNLPDGLNPNVNLSAEMYYDHSNYQFGEFQSEVWAVSDYVLSQVVASESLVRVFGNAVRRFNRLIAKLEAQSFSLDF